MLVMLFIRCTHVSVAAAVVAAAVVLGCGLIGAPVQAQGTGSSFVQQPWRDGGAAAISNPYGGEYVYSAKPPTDGRAVAAIAAIVLGERRRTEFTLFSAEEEEALWRLRDRQLHPEPVEPKPAIRAAKRVAKLTIPSVEWPKVVVVGGKTCVPTLQFSDAPDWRDHLVCWSSGAQRVE